MDNWNRIINGLAIGIFLAGACGAILLQQQRVRSNYTESEMRAQIANDAAELATAKATIAQLSQVNSAMTRQGAEEYSARTILADQKHPEVVSAEVTMFGRRVDFSNAGPVWVIPRRVVPTLQNNAQGGVYGYLDASGNLIDGWHLAVKGQ
jgi:hypothetical protein